VSRQRASTAREAIGRAMTPQPARTAARSESEARSAPAASDRPSKFTLLLDADAAADFDALAVQLRRQLGRRVEKAAIVRALIALAADDTTLRDQLAREIRSNTDRPLNG
jgi:hypothetical protein